MAKRDIVLDTNVLVSALRSNRGASHELLLLIGETPEIQLHLSVPLTLEYESIGKKHCRELGLTHRDIDEIVDYLCSVSEHHEVYFLWRPYLPDPKHDMLLELAVSAGCDCIVTHNIRDFRGSEKFSIRVVSPRQLLLELGRSP